MRSQTIRLTPPEHFRHLSLSFDMNYDFYGMNILFELEDRTQDLRRWRGWTRYTRSEVTLLFCNESARDVDGILEGFSVLISPCASCCCPEPNLSLSFNKWVIRCARATLRTETIIMVIANTSTTTSHSGNMMESWAAIFRCLLTPLFNHRLGHVYLLNTQAEKANQP